jgi:hypothetical protein
VTKKPYEFIKQDPRGLFRGVTFGCGCCSDSKELRTDEEIVEAYTATVQMYREMAKGYAAQLALIKEMGSAAIHEALMRYDTYQRNLEAYRAAQQHMRAPRSAGSFGERCAGTDLNTWLLRVMVSQEVLHFSDYLVVTTFRGGF